MIHAFALTESESESESELLGEIAECDALLASCDAAARAAPLASSPLRLPFGRARRDLPASLDTVQRIGRPHCHGTAAFADWRPERAARDVADEMVTHVTAMWQAERVPVLPGAGQGKGDGWPPASACARRGSRRR